ncbi:hypothetical protein C7S16_0469 [Burkholderia thailandensis]|uniref:Uncharacterized protein n=1 Tax=Burkholderia thailandensis TaxID=57975 RepID=A0AAW9D448_BURTH|nr:hypothetical protein [Burkholderia thailandensis]MDW9256451.1 hypothetical protein [Burkholderia thailandensis]
MTARSVRGEISSFLPCARRPSRKRVRPISPNELVRNANESLSPRIGCLCVERASHTR